MNLVTVRWRGDFVALVANQRVAPGDTFEMDRDEALARSDVELLPVSKPKPASEPDAGLSEER